MTKNGFPFPMTKKEKIFGWIYVFIHIVALPYGLSYGIAFLERQGIAFPEKYDNLVYYCIGAVLIFIFMNHFMKNSFYDLCENKMNTFRAITVSYVAYYILSAVVGMALMYFIGEADNPNDDAINTELFKNKSLMLAIAAIVGPVVEEVLFRGVVFGSIRKHSRIAAYAISMILFSVYHLYSYFIYAYDPKLFLYLIQYLPAGFALAWCYEHSRNIWGSIFMHMLINYIVLSVNISLR